MKRKRIGTNQTDKPPDEFKSEGYLRVDNRLIRLHGLNLAIFTSNLIDKYLYFKKHHTDLDGWFFLTHEDQIKQTGLTEYMIVKCKRQAILNKWITTKLIGSKDYVTREYYELNLEHPDIQIAIEFSRGSPPRIRREVPPENDGFLNKTIYQTKESSSSGDEGSFSEKEITPPLFEKFWEKFPIASEGKGKGSKGIKAKAKKKWNELGIETNPPLWKTVWSALIQQIKSERWKSGFIPHVSTWLEQSRWGEDPKGMKKVSNEDKEPKCLYGSVFGSYVRGRQGCDNCEVEEGKTFRRCLLTKQEKEKQ